MNTPDWSNYLNQFKDVPILHIPIESIKVAVIVEPRILSQLPLVIRNFMYLLKGWACVVIHGTENGDFIRTELSDVPNIQYFQLHVQNLTVTQYNDLLCDDAFWAFLHSRGYRHALSFEWDTLLLNGNIDQFLGYDYIGAPWKNPQLKTLTVGNSGLCIRNIETMLHITQTCPRAFTIELGKGPTRRKGVFNAHNNDVYFAYWCKQKGYRIPTPEISGQFSMETKWYAPPCGLHAPAIDTIPHGIFEQLLSVRHV